MVSPWCGVAALGAGLCALLEGTHPGPTGRSPAGTGLEAGSGLPHLLRRLHRRSCTARDRQGPGTEGGDPQEARHEQDACRHGEGEPPPRDRRATRGRGQDLPDELYGGCCCAQHPACKTSVHRRFRTRGTPWAWRTTAWRAPGVKTAPPAGPPWPRAGGYTPGSPPW